MPAAFLISCQEDAAKIKYSVNVSVVNDFTTVVDAINNGSLKNEAAIKALIEAIDKMNADQSAKLQAIVDVLNSVDATLEAKLAAVEAAIKSQTLSLEAKLELLEKAINAQTVSLEAKADLLEKAVKALTDSIDDMNASQSAKLQAIAEVLTSVSTTVETKLAALEAAVKAATLSLEGKLDLLSQAIKALPDYSSKLEAIETAIAGLPDYGEKIDAIRSAIAALPDYSEKFSAVVSALGFMEKSLKDAIGGADESLAGKLAEVSSEISDLIKSVDLGNESAVSALDKIFRKLDDLKTAIGGESSSDDDDEDYVDLGLSVKWAKCNLGAEKPWDYGDYYSWGEIETKAEYTWESYKWMNPNVANEFGYTKYTIDDEYFFGVWYDNEWNFIGDGKASLDLEDDAAAAKLGSPWRMPTKEEFDELLQCDMYVAICSGVRCVRIIGPNGNSIFLPFAGGRDGSSPYNVGNNPIYWSSTLGSRTGYAWYFTYYLYSGDHFASECELPNVVGLSIRPVHP